MPKKGYRLVPAMNPCYSAKETLKLLPQRRYHDNSACSVAGAIAEGDRRVGKTSGFVAYSLCEECEQLNAASS